MNYKSLGKQFKGAHLSAPLPLLWEAYIILCQKGWTGDDALNMCDWQWKDTNDFLTIHHQMFLDWCRFSGKTEKGSLIAVFFTLLGIETMWFAKATNQFMRVQKLWNANPFCTKVRPNRQRKSMSLVTGDAIAMEVLLTEENCSGPHPKCIIYDEFALMDVNLMAKANLMLGPDPWILYISTPVLGSPTTAIRKDVETRTHTVMDCKWKDPIALRKLVIRGQEWMWDQDMMCKEILPQGAVFVNVMETRTYPEEFDEIVQGVDFNGQANKNILVRIGYAHDQIWVLKEEAFAYKLEDNLLQHRVNEFSTEVECGGWNDTYAPNLVNCTKKDFGENKGQLKIDRVKELTNCLIYINPQLAPHLLDDLRHAFWGEDGKIDTHPLHYLAALMHASRKGLKVFRPGTNPDFKFGVGMDAVRKRAQLEGRLSGK